MRFLHPKLQGAFAIHFLRINNVNLQTHEGHTEKLVKIEPKANPVRLS